MEETNTEKFDPEIVEIVKDMVLFDDDLMKVVFENNFPATELVLSIILERDDLKVESVTSQMELHSPQNEGRTITLDILAIDKKGKYYDIEVQRASGGANTRRARFHSSSLDVRMLKKNQSFKELNDSYTIFITEDDYWKKGLPLYHLERIVKELGQDAADGSHIIYVNGSYKGDDPIGKLMSDFHAKKSSEMNYKPLADSVKNYKEVEGGQGTMCKAVELYAEKRARNESIMAARIAADQRATDNALKMLSKGKLSLEEISEYTGLPLSVVEALANQKRAAKSICVPR
ncbi:MAG: PD-(D/E)XK nuclease family transposase [Treponema sp.]|nr:PD-(D/E)XK nuclease family transposase [Treponema sp.]